MRFPIHTFGLAALIGIVANTAPALAQADVAQGQKLFAQRCTVCHSLSAAQKKPTGPHLEKLFGRKAASVEEFNYSAGMKGSNIVWDEKSVTDYLAGPAKLVPGTTMPVGVPQAADREDIVAYLKSLPK